MWGRGTFTWDGGRSSRHPAPRASGELRSAWLVGDLGGSLAVGSEAGTLERGVLGHFGGGRTPLVDVATGRHAWTHVRRQVAPGDRQVMRHAGVAKVEACLRGAGSNHVVEYRVGHPVSGNRAQQPE